MGEVKQNTYVGYAERLIGNKLQGFYLYNPINSMAFFDIDLKTIEKSCVHVPIDFDYDEVARNNVGSF